MSFVNPDQVVSNYRAAKLADDLKRQNDADNMFMKAVDYVLTDYAPWTPGNFDNLGGNIQKKSEMCIWISAHNVSRNMMDQAKAEVKNHGWRAYEKYDGGYRHVLEITPNNSLNSVTDPMTNNENKSENDEKNIGRNELGLVHSGAPKTQLEVVVEKLCNIANELTEMRKEVEQNHGVQIDEIRQVGNGVKKQNTNLLRRLWGILRSCVCCGE